MQVFMTTMLHLATRLWRPHQPRVFTGCGFLTVLHFSWRYSTTAAFTAQYLSTCRDNFSESLMFTHVNDFTLHLGYFADPSSQHWRQRFLCCCDLSLEQLARSSPFFNISSAFRKSLKTELFTRSCAD